VNVSRSGGGVDVKGAVSRSRVDDRDELRDVESEVRQCSLVGLYDTEAHFLRPLLTVQPSITMSY
jgi:hypothetical protein